MRKNKKGFALVELLVVVAVVAMTTPLLFWVYLYGIQTFSTDNRYVEQHYKIIDVTQRIRSDIEKAAACKVVYDASATPLEASVLALWIPDDDADTADNYFIRIWRLEDGKLLFKSGTGGYGAGSAQALDSSGYDTLLDGLDTAAAVKDDGTAYMPTRFEKLGDRVVLSIKPIETNERAFKNRNVTKPIITEFSVAYKDLVN